ncbi:hypothetical protein [Hoeflea sp.]|uniref:hypothetical protein n=1 Tax=Hoeflea sp. TaxID=1940281 RepID=UPI00374A658E
MNTIFRNALAAIVVATAGFAASAPAATAGDIGFSLSIGGGGGGIVIRDRDHRGGWDRFEGRRGYDRGFCKPRRALKKARHMGVRRADIVRAGYRRVVVEGIKHHRPVRVVFANERRCPVIAVRR